MSALLAPLSDTARRPRLRGVAAPQQRLGGLGFLVLLAVILAIGTFGLLVLNTKINEQQFALSDLDQQAATLTEQEASLQTQLNALSSSTELSRRAAQLGMVPAPLGYLHLADGRVEGDPKPATGKDLPHVRTDQQVQDEARAKEEADRKAKEEAAAKAAQEAADKAKASASPSPSAAASPGASPSAAGSPAASPAKPASAAPSATPTPTTGH